MENLSLEVKTFGLVLCIGKMGTLWTVFSYLYSSEKDGSQSMGVAICYKELYLTPLKHNLACS